MISIIRTDAEHPHFRQLVVLLDQDLHVRDGLEHAFYAQFNKVSNIRHVVICYDNDEPIGCGAFKPYDENSVEVKRMYVQPSHRDKGIGLQILQELERWAGESGYRSTVLETGKKQPEAIRLYQKAGYSPITNFGPYKNIDNSICMQKVLV